MPVDTTLVHVHDDNKLHVTAVSFAGSQSLRDLFVQRWEYRAVDLPDAEKGVTRLTCPTAGDLWQIIALSAEELKPITVDWLKAICQSMGETFKTGTKPLLIARLKKALQKKEDTHVVAMEVSGV